jgi:hypothetical protein
MHSFTYSGVMLYAKTIERASHLISSNSAAEYLTLQKYFSHPSLGYILFCNPTHKTETIWDSK